LWRAALATSCGTVTTDDGRQVLTEPARPSDVHPQHPPQLPDHPLSRQEIPEVKQLIVQVGERLLGDPGRRSTESMADFLDLLRRFANPWEHQSHPDPIQTFVAWLRSQGCVAEARIPTAEAEGATAYRMLTANPPQLPFVIDLRVLSDDGSTKVETHRLSLYIYSSPASISPILLATGRADRVEVVRRQYWCGAAPRYITTMTAEHRMDVPGTACSTVQ